MTSGLYINLSQCFGHVDGFGATVPEIHLTLGLPNAAVFAPINCTIREQTPGGRGLYPLAGISTSGIAQAASEATHSSGHWSEKRLAADAAMYRQGSDQWKRALKL